jgi:2-polyprenyl-3-methyl-5-hydroxy-6-metoxy-1,4-benzoquinol methylase
MEELRKSIDDKLTRNSFKNYSNYKESEFYDKIYRKFLFYQKKPSKSKMYPVWKKILRKIKLSGWNKILDLGCGPGQFGQLCFDKGCDYFGVDFSEEAIKIAKEGDYKDAYVQSDIFEFITKYDIHNYDVIVMIEILEHIIKDIELLELLPDGQNVIISVPNYLSKSHVRCFENISNVIDRYGILIDISYFEVHTSKKGENKIYILAGKIKNQNNKEV